jgi:hypothetical protein
MNIRNVQRINAALGSKLTQHKIATGLREAISYANGAPAQARVTRYQIPDNSAKAT